MVKVYLSGQITGLPEVKVKHDFALAACKVLEVINDEVEIINPTTLPKTCDTWADYLLRALMFLKGCDVIAMLPNWEASAGAKTEREFAKGCGIQVIEL